MQTADPSRTVKELSAALASLSEDIQQHAGPLSSMQLNWKPNPSEWSVGQCIDHLLVTNTSYIPQIDQTLAGTKRSTFWERLPFLPRFYGRMLIKVLGPDSGQAVKAPTAFLPTQSEVDPQIVPRFVQMQEEMRVRMAACQALPLDSIIITSPATHFVVYSLLDAFRIIVVHEQNHFNQLMRLIQHPEFP